MTHGQHQHHIQRLDVSVERHVARAASRYDELSQTLLGGPAYERMAFEQAKRLHYELNGFARCRRIMLDEKVGQSLQVAPNALLNDYLRQRLSRGRRAGLPATRARRYLRTSSKA